MSGPDAPTEGDTERNGAFSYAGEFHAFAIGAFAGLAAALSYGTALQPAGLAAFLGVVAVALGLSKSERFRNSLAVGEVEKEPWYAAGGAVIVFFVGAGVRVLLTQFPA